MSYRYADAEQIQELRMERFAGVDFSSDPTKVDAIRSPDACNMIGDEAGFPCKRTGYVCEEEMDAPIYGLHRMDDELLIHAGSNLYSRKGENLSLLCSKMNTARSQSFRMNGKLWILDGMAYRVYDGTECVPVREKAFVPTTTIGAPPSGGGTSFEAVNMLTPYRINTFVGDGVTKTFQLDTTNFDAGSISCEGQTVYAFNRAKGTVTFTEPPPDGEGLANVVIRFAKTVPEHADKIDRCRICGLYGGSNDTRVFVSGDPQEPNCDWQSGLYDPTYFPDTGYTKVGVDSTAIVGYLRQYDNQIVLKEDGQDAKQYLRSFALDENNRAAYSLKQGAEAVGALSAYALGELEGTPLYLSAEGVMGVFGTNVSEQRVISCMSERVNRRLLREAGRKDAAGCVWKGRYYLAVNDHCYVADGRQRSNGVPEWYYWDNIPATCFLAEEDALWFGTQDGRVCRFCTEEEADAYLDDGAAICAHWSTPLSALGSWNDTKNVLSMIPVLMPFARSSAEVLWKTERESGIAESVSMTRFCFSDLDFTRFVFQTSISASPVPVRQRQRRAYLFQGIVRNDKAKEPFGLLGLSIRYTVRAPVRKIGG